MLLLHLDRNRRLIGANDAFRELHPSTPGEIVRDVLDQRAPARRCHADPAEIDGERFDLARLGEARHRMEFVEIGIGLDGPGRRAETTPVPKPFATPEYNGAMKLVSCTD